MKKLVLLILFLPYLSYSQEATEQEKISAYMNDFKLKTKEIVALGINPIDYLYAGTNLDRKGLEEDAIKDIKALYYWSTSCHYCKKELKELKELLTQKPEWQDQILIAMRVDYKNKEASIKQEGEEYILYKGDKEVLRSPVKILFISEKFAEDTKRPANPHAFFFDTDKNIINYKSGYFVSKKNKIDDINQKLNKQLLTAYLE